MWTHPRQRGLYFGGRGRTTIPAAADCSFSAFSRFCLSPKRHAPADGQTVNLGIIFGLILPCTLRFGNGWHGAVWVSFFGAFCALLRGTFAPFQGLETKCTFFVRCIVFLVQMAYNDSASRKGMISWLELRQTSASEWTAT